MFPWSKRLEPTVAPEPAQGRAGGGYALETQLNLKVLLLGAVSALPRARLSHPPPPPTPATRKSRRKGGCLPGSGALRELESPQHLSTDARVHLCFQGAGPPSGVQRGGHPAESGGWLQEP